MNILIQGATGTVGGEVATQLLEQDNHKIYIAARDLDKAKEKFGDKPEYKKFDVEDESTYENALEGIDKIFYMSPGIVDTSDQAMKLFYAAKKAGVKHIVNMSAKGVNHSDNPLRRVELALENSGLDYTFIRPGWFSDNFNKFWKDWIKEGELASSMQDGKLAYVDSRDIAAVSIAALESDKHISKAYELTGPEAIDNHEATKILSEVSGRKINYKEISEEEEKKRLKEMGMPKEGVEYMLRIIKMVRDGMAAETTDHVEKVLGRKPHSFKKYAEDRQDRIFD